jgi:hypothetical protein
VKKESVASYIVKFMAKEEIPTDVFKRIMRHWK